MFFIRQPYWLTQVVTLKQFLLKLCTSSRLSVRMGEFFQLLTLGSLDVINTIQDEIVTATGNALGPWYKEIVLCTYLNKNISFILDRSCWTTCNGIFHIFQCCFHSFLWYFVAVAYFGNTPHQESYHTQGQPATSDR